MTSGPGAAALPFTRRDVSFATHDGVMLRGWLYLPQAGERGAGIVMTHGFSATKEMGLDGHAEAFVAVGYAVLLYDHRAIGESDGQPRRLIDPFVQTRDMMTAVGWLADRPQIDRNRIGVWGTSYSGGEALVLAALDTRVRAVAAIVPAVGSPEAVPADSGPAWAALAARVRDATINATATVGPRAVVPAADALPGAVMPDPATTAWMLREGGRPEANWRNEVLTPVWRADAPPFDPAPALPYLQAPILLIAGSEDRVTPAANARAAAALAGGKAEFLLLTGHHCSFYAGGPRDLAAAAATDFYRRRL